MGAAWMKKRNFTKAIKAFTKATALNKKYAQAWINLGSAKEMNNDIEGAIAAWKMAVVNGSEEAQQFINYYQN